VNAGVKWARRFVLVCVLSLCAAGCGVATGPADQTTSSVADALQSFARDFVRQVLAASLF